MGTLIVIPFVLPAFFARDFFLLRMGPVSTTLVRLKVYALALLMSVLLFSAATFSLETSRLLQILLSPAVTLPIVLFYGVLLVASIWVRRTDRHQVAWHMAVIPNPVLVLGLAVLARLVLPQVWSYASIVDAIMLTCLWIGLIAVSVWRANKTPMDVPDLDFSLGLAGLANSAALMVLPLEALVTGSTGWNDLFRRLGALLSVD